MGEDWQTQGVKKKINTRGRGKREGGFLWKVCERWQVQSACVYYEKRVNDYLYVL